MCKNKRKKHKEHKKRVGVSVVFSIIGLILAAIIVISVPFGLDWLYGKGMLAWYNNAFRAEAWFSFIGSYFPATIIGLLSLYQAYIIQYREKQYKKALSKHRFIPAGQASVYRYRAGENTIGAYSYYDIEQMFARNSRNGLSEDWMFGYIVESEVYCSSGIRINKADVKKVEWEIDGTTYCQDNPEKMISIVKRVSHSQQQIIIYWIFDEFKKINDIIVQCMINNSRHNIRYETSIITVTLQIIDDEGQSCGLKMQLVMRAQGDNSQMSSIEEYYICEVI